MVSPTCLNCRARMMRLPTLVAMKRARIKATAERKEMYWNIPAPGKSSLSRYSKRGTNMALGSKGCVYVGNYLLIIEGVFDTLYFLVIFVAFTRHQDDITRRGHQTGRSDGVLSVNLTEHSFAVDHAYAFLHIGQDGQGVFKPGIIGSKDNQLTPSQGFFGHQGTLAFVPVATGTHYGNDAPLTFNQFIESDQYVFKGIGCMSVVHNGKEAGG